MYIFLPPSSSHQIAIKMEPNCYPFGNPASPSSGHYGIVDSIEGEEDEKEETQEEEK